MTFNHQSAHTRRQRGIMLVEALMYLAVTALLVGLGMMLFLRCLGTATGLSRNADDIAGATRLGELWRADLRLATAPPRLADANTNELIIPQRAGEVAYRFAERGISRRAAGETDWMLRLERVIRANWNSSPRAGVAVWHFDLELKTQRPHARLRPLFSFIGVAGEPKP